MGRKFDKRLRFVAECLLFGAGHFDRFPTYAALHAYCVRHGIDAKQD